MARRARDLVGRKLRADGGVLVAGVVTYPVSREIVEAIPGEAERHAAWQTATVRWLVERYKAAVVSIVARR